MERIDKNIQDKLKWVIQEVTNNLLNGITLESKEELAAVNKSTQEATDKILNSLEKIREIIQIKDNAALVTKLEKEVSNIYAACNFQDITGQRVKKITSNIQHIETVATNIALVLDGKNSGSIKPRNNPTKNSKDSDLMNGPQIDGKAPSQGDVDKLFDSI